MTDYIDYSRMQKDFYRDLSQKSDYQNENYTIRNDAEWIVGHYAMHEKYDYEKFLFEGIEHTQQMLALDYGCGPGRMLKRLTNLFKRVDGVDLSEEVLEVAKNYCASLKNPPHLFLNDGLSLSMLDDSSYNLVYSVICLQHICVYTIRKKIITEIYRVLADDGIMTFQLGYGPGHPYPTRYHDDFISAPATNGANDVMVLHPWEPIKDLLEVGFQDIHYSIVPVCPGDSHGSWIFLQARKKQGQKISVYHLNKEVSIQELEQNYEYFLENYSKISINQRVLSQEDQLLQQNIEKQALTTELQNVHGAFDSYRKHHELLFSAMTEKRIQDIRYLCKVNSLRLGLFGAGQHTEKIFNCGYFQPSDIYGIYDNNAEIWDQKKFGVTVKPPQDITTDDLDVIIISSKAFAAEIEHNLRKEINETTLIINLYPEPQL